MNTLQKNAKKAGLAAKAACLKRDPNFYSKIAKIGLKKRWGTQRARSAEKSAPPKTSPTSDVASPATSSH